MSDVDIEPGARWLATVGAELDSTSVGIVCVTREALNSRWLNFEAGALAKRVSEAHVVPLLIDVGKTDVTGPLSQFQLVLPDRDGITKLLALLNASLGDRRIETEVLEDAIDTYWPRLETRLAQALDQHGSGKQAELLPPERDQGDILAEILELVRDQRRTTVTGPSITEYLTLDDFTRVGDAYRVLKEIETNHGRVSASTVRKLIDLIPILRSVMACGKEAIVRERRFTMYTGGSIVSQLGGYADRIPDVDMLDVVDGVSRRELDDLERIP